MLFSPICRGKNCNTLNFSAQDDRFQNHFIHDPSTCNGENGPPAVDTALLAGLSREYASLYGRILLTNIATTCLAIRSPYVRNSRSREGCKSSSLHGLSPDSLLISGLMVEPLLPSHSNQLGRLEVYYHTLIKCLFTSQLIGLWKLSKFFPFTTSHLLHTLLIY